MILNQTNLQCPIIIWINSSAYQNEQIWTQVFSQRDYDLQCHTVSNCLFLEVEQVKMTPIWTWFFVVIIFRFAKSITILLYPAP